jgi:hypothetical protein
MLISAAETDGLRPEEKDAILDAMLGMAWSDGSIHLDELDLLRRIASFLTDRPIDDLVKDYKVDQARVSTKIGSSDLGPGGKRLMLRIMAYVAAASGDVDEKELAFYRGCQRAFGMPDRLREQLESDVHREVYSEHLKRRLLANELDEPAKEELRKRLGLEESVAADLEARVRRSLPKK